MCGCESEKLAQRADLTTKALRFYEQAQLLPMPARTASGYRDYDDTALGRLRFIRAAQTAGLTLAEIRTIIEVREHEGPPCEHVTALLDQHASALGERIRELQATRAEVRRLRVRATTLDPATCREDSVCHVIPTS